LYSQQAQVYDGNLEVHEIYGMNLDGVNMVVLSACKSALGASSTGDELVGLTRAFLYAGTPSIIATLWSVEARATRKLMTSFYTYLSKGKTPATALQEAQIEMLRNDAYRPYHWAAFALTGDYRGGIKP
jgi:CHAT domain-containing protein